MSAKTATAIASVSVACVSLVSCSASPAHQATPTSGPTHSATLSPTATPEQTTPDVTLAYFRPGVGVVGLSPSCCGYQGSDGPSQLWLTTDMQHWRNVTPPGSKKGYSKSDAPVFEDAWFTDARTGWVTSWDTGNLKVKIFRTSNSGRSWSEVSGGELSVHAGSADYVQPVSPTLGYIDGFDPAGPTMGLAVTHDGGRHWTSVYGGPPPRTSARQPLGGPFEMPMVFTGASRGFAANGLPAADPILGSEPNPGYLFRTDDSGRHWIRVHPPRPPASRSCPRDGQYRAAVTCLDGVPTFVTAMDGLLPVVVRRHRQAVVGVDITRDAGTEWTLADTLNVAMAATAISPDGGYEFTTPLVSIASMTTWWVTVPRHDGTASWWTSDGGRHWHHNASSLPGTPTALSATSSRTAWLIVDVQLHDGSTARQLMRTTDGGRTWHLLRTGPLGPWFR